MSAREIIEARLGRKLPPAQEMRPDERKAVLLLGLQLERSKHLPSDHPDYLQQILEKRP